MKFRFVFFLNILILILFKKIFSFCVKKISTLFYILSYEYFNLEELDVLPLNNLCTNNGLICIWLTNNKRIHEHVENVLKNEWNFQIIGQWHWIKVSNYKQYNK